MLIKNDMLGKWCHLMTYIKKEKFQSQEEWLIKIKPYRLSPILYTFYCIKSRFLLNLQVQEEEENNEP